MARSSHLSQVRTSNQRLMHILMTTQPAQRHHGGWQQCYLLLLVLHLQWSWREIWR